MKSKAMKKGYWELWNDDVQARIDENIEKFRKADAKWKIKGLKAGTPVRAEQISHRFIFGSHIFNFDQLGTDERNEKYKALFGTLFNSATVAFYWKTLEPREGYVRLDGEYRDTAEYWNSVKEPKLEPHWRRPAPGPVIDFCEAKKIRIHGHPLVWANYYWHYPQWQLKHLPPEWVERMDFNGDPKVSPAIAAFKDYTPEQLAELIPGYSVKMQTLMAKRIAEIALKFGKRVHSWDVCNESAVDYSRGELVPDSVFCKSTRYGLMPGDYTFRAFKLAEAMLPAGAKLNINDYFRGDAYGEQVRELKKRGCKIDIMGMQMHLFKPQDCLDIADGISDKRSPESEFALFEMMSKCNLPIHLSEITITSPGNDARGQEIQAVMTRNLYRLWFSIEKMMGITWWNLVDDCGAPGEPLTSGLFSRNMEPKPAYYVLDDLINREWKTRADLTAGEGGTVSFRGFRGTYRVSWTAPGGEEKTQLLELK